VLGDGDVIAAAVSLDVGSVRLTERLLHSDPPSPAEIAAARALMEATLDAAARRVDLGAARTLIGVAGTVTTITAHALRLPAYDSAAVHGARLPVTAVRAACADLLHLSRHERSGLPYLHPGRVDVIGAGALIWDLVVDRVAHRAGVEQVVTSEHDILDGVAWELADTCGNLAG
jgi:exopolyphosphatase/guanosine-5'-triphosphate,3'-diphosphate pyrophosphatase